MGIPTPVPPSDEQKSALVERIIRGELSPEQAQQRHGLTRAQLKEWVRIYRREARRAFDDRVKSVLSTQGLDMDELSGAEFSGNVEDMSVAELLQTIQLGGKDAEIRIEQGPRLSHLWCVGGDVIDAETAELRGAPAAYRMLGYQLGRIHADFSPVERPRRIHLSTAALLMEGARRFDECREMRDKIGEMHAVFVPSDRSLAPDVQATPQQFAVLRLFDGFRNLDEVVAVSPVADLETLTCILALRDGGLLERVRPSRTSVREELAITLASVEPPEQSFVPTAQSVGSRARGRSRYWVRGIAVLGAATLGSALAVRFADQRQARQQSAGVPAAQPAATTTSSPASSRLPEAPAGSGAPSSGDGASVEHVEKARAERPAQAAQTAPFAHCPDGAVLFEPELAAAPSRPTEAAQVIAPFCLARTEVTVADYERCRELAACTPLAGGDDPPEARLSPELRPHAQRVYASQCNAGQPGRERHPINCVSFQQASAYCTSAGGRLPTEAEWDVAARGDEGREFPWGSAPPDATRLNACGSECKAWYGELRLDSVFDSVMYDGDDGFAGTAPVASYPAGATRDGIYDLLGNVAEWTSTVVDFGQARAVAPAGGTYVVRGGSFSTGGTAVRVYLPSEAHGRGVGFRCAWEPR